MADEPTPELSAAQRYTVVEGATGIYVLYAQTGELAQSFRHGELEAAEAWALAGNTPRETRTAAETAFLMATRDHPPTDNDPRYAAAKAADAEFAALIPDKGSGPALDKPDPLLHPSVVGLFGLIHFDVETGSVIDQEGEPLKHRDLVSLHNILRLLKERGELG